MADDMDLDGWIAEGFAPSTPIDWFQHRMKESGITQSVAETCGFKLKIGERGAFFTIPYFNVDNIQTQYAKQRNRETGSFDGDHSVYSGGQALRKYTQLRGSKPQVYWPPIGKHRRLYNHPAYPMLICEGELKSVKAQMEANASSIDVLVCGVPGTRLPETIKQELMAVPMLFPASPGVEEARRTVFLALDWNERGDARERGLELEFELTQLLQKLGARVVLLRWEPGTGPQKLDEWLVAGGDLGKAMLEAIAADNATHSDLAELWEYCNNHYAFCFGRYIPLSSPFRSLSSHEFNLIEAARRLPKTAKTFWPVSESWGMQPKECVNTVEGIGFKPSALGVKPDTYYWEDGKRFLNVAPFVDIDLPPWDDGGCDVAPFVALVQRLCQDTTEWMLNYLAHTAQHPTKRAQHVVIFKDSGSTGKSALFATLAEVFGGYTGNVGNSLNSHFNAPLLGKTLAFWSEPVVRGGNDKAVVSAIKNVSGDAYMDIERKHCDAVRVRNYVRLFIATNNLYVVPVEKGERRWYVAGGKTKLLPAEWQEYKKWLDAGGIMKIRKWLVERDITGYDVTLPPPMTEQRLEMECDSAGPIESLLQEPMFELKDIWSVDEIIAEYERQNGHRISNVKIGLFLKRAGHTQIVIKRDGKARRLWQIRGDISVDDTDAWWAEFGRTEAKF